MAEEDNLSASQQALQLTDSQAHTTFQGYLFTSAVYFAATLLMETGWLQWGFHLSQGWLKKTTSRLLSRRRSQQGYEQTQTDAVGEVAEDEDVREEREALQAGRSAVHSSLLCLPGR